MLCTTPASVLMPVWLFDLVILVKLASLNSTSALQRSAASHVLDVSNGLLSMHLDTILLVTIYL